MGLFKKIFGLKKSKEELETVSQSIQDVPEYEENEEVKDCSFLSYGNGCFTMPIEGFVHGVKRYGSVRAFDMKHKQFVTLSSLGKDLLLYNAKEETLYPLIDNKDEDFEPIRKYIFESTGLPDDYKGDL